MNGIVDTNILNTLIEYCRTGYNPQTDRFSIPCQYEFLCLIVLDHVLDRMLLWELQYSVKTWKLDGFFVLVIREE